MNKLKAFNMPRYAGVLTTHEVYLKSEADKVIAELKHQRDAAFGLTKSGLTLDDLSQMARKEIDRQKHKRCLAMAEACMHKRWRPDECFDYARITRHMKKWLELAEKFKEAK